MTTSPTALRGPRSPRRLLGPLATFLAVGLLAACGPAATSGAGPAPGTTTPGTPTAPAAPATTSATSPAAGASAPTAADRTRPVLVAAVGDIACDPASPYFAGGAGKGGFCRHSAVARLVASRKPAAFFPLGDIQYDNGTITAFRNSYDTAFGELLPITYPVPGNHEYGTSDAEGYWKYFGDRAGKAGQGWYSFDLGAWHVVALNANCDVVGCAAGSPQERWLRADLAKHRSRCTLAMWHQPRWSSGTEHGDGPATGPLVKALYAAGAEVILSGHDHDYERFTPLTPAGTPDRARGVRQFVVGTGGKVLYGVRGRATTEAKDATTFGALFLTLKPTSYAWRYVAATGSFTDAGTTACH